ARSPTKLPAQQSVLLLPTTTEWARTSAAARPPPSPPRQPVPVRPRPPRDTPNVPGGRCTERPTPRPAVPIPAAPTPASRPRRFPATTPCWRIQDRQCTPAETFPAE